MSSVYGWERLLARRHGVARRGARAWRPDKRGADLLRPPHEVLRGARRRHCHRRRRRNAPRRADRAAARSRSREGDALGGGDGRADGEHPLVRVLARGRLKVDGLLGGADQEACLVDEEARVILGNLDDIGEDKKIIENIVGKEVELAAADVGKGDAKEDEAALLPVADALLKLELADKHDRAILDIQIALHIRVENVSVAARADVRRERRNVLKGRRRFGRVAAMARCPYSGALGLERLFRGERDRAPGVDHHGGARILLGLRPLVRGRRHRGAGEK